MYEEPSSDSNPLMVLKERTNRRNKPAQLPPVDSVAEVFAGLSVSSSKKTPVEAPKEKPEKPKKPKKTVIKSGEKKATKTKKKKDSGETN